MTMKKLTREGATFVIEYDSLVNRTVRRIKPSGIRKFFDIANEMDDVISLSVGEPDFHTPWHIREAGIESLEKGRTSYTPNRGFLKLRAEISNFIERHYHVKYDPQDEVLVTVGGSEAIDLCVRSFVCYVPITEMAGGVPVIIETKPENGFRLTAQELEEKITDKTKLLILPYPNNPTGAVMRRADLEAVARVVERHNLLVLSDEIYAALTYGSEPHTAFSAIPGMQERTILVNGFSKSHSMTGWRMGYAAGPKEIISLMTKLHQFAIMSAPTMSQYAAIEAMKNGDDDIEYMRGQYDMRRRLIVDGLNNMGLKCFEPEGAFYVFPSVKSSAAPTGGRWCPATPSAPAARALCASPTATPPSTSSRPWSAWKRSSRSCKWAGKRCGSPGAAATPRGSCCARWRRPSPPWVCGRRFAPA